MAYTKLIPRQIGGGSVEKISDGNEHDGYRLSIPMGIAGKYRLAQMDDYTKSARGRFPLWFHLSLSLSARASSHSIPGTWGFGLWNDPFGMSLGFGGTVWRLPTLPNAVWFFHGSRESHLSFRAGLPAQGFLAQVFRSPSFHPWLIPAGLALPFSRKLTRRLLAKVIGEDGIDLRRRGSPLAPSTRAGVAPTGALESAPYTRLDVTQWHRYRLDWREDWVSFEVDHVAVFESRVSPKPPLGLVIWIDNQYAAFTPEGKIGFGVLENPEPAWLEIKEIDVSMQS